MDNQPNNNPLGSPPEPTPPNEAESPLENSPDLPEEPAQPDPPATEHSPDFSEEPTPPNDPESPEPAPDMPEQPTEPEPPTSVPVTVQPQPLNPEPVVGGGDVQPEQPPVQPQVMGSAAGGASNKAMIFAAFGALGGLLVGLLLGAYVLGGGGGELEDYVRYSYEEIYGDDYQETLDNDLELYREALEEGDSSEESDDVSATESSDSANSESSSSSDVSGSATDVVIKDEISSLSTKFEIYYAENGYYPLVSQVEDGAWLMTYLSNVSTELVLDANGYQINESGSLYTYTAGDCDSLGCQTFKLSGTLSDGTDYTRESLF